MEFTTKDNNNNDDNNESFSVQFWQSFNSQFATISSALQAAERVASADSLAHVKSMTVNLQNFATTSAIDLPKYDIRRSQEEIDKLKKSISALESAVQPKKKFSFSSRNKGKKSAGSSVPVPSKTEAELTDTDTASTSASTSASTNASTSTPLTESSDQDTVTVPKASAFLAKSICVEDKADEECIDITTTVEQDIGYQVYIKNCNNCTISVRTTIGSARLENLTGCRVYLGPCCTSTYVENCTDCTFFIRCHQLRIHHAYNSSFYVLVNSHPIIEDCSTLGFAPYHASYDTLARDLKVANLNGAENWNNVVDFRWHRTTASPNWSVIPPEERVVAIDAAGWSIGTCKDEDCDDEEL